jgi:hypothetical protein
MGVTIWCVEAAPVQSMELYYYVNYHFYLDTVTMGLTMLTEMHRCNKDSSFKAFSLCKSFFNIRWYL